MARPQMSLTAAQQVRYDLIVELLRRPERIRMVDVIFSADAAAKFVMTTEVVGFSPGEDVDERPGVSSRKGAGSSERA